MLYRILAMVDSEQRKRILTLSNSGNLIYKLVTVQLVMAADRLIQDKLSVTRSKDNSVLFTCKGSTGCYNYIHWYQKKEGEAFKRILYIPKDGGAPVKDPGFDRFLAEKANPDTFNLWISVLKVSDSATYYCACWISHIVSCSEESNHAYNTHAYSGHSRSCTNMAFLSVNVAFVLLHVVLAADRLIQEKLSVTRSKTKTALISCRGTGDCSSYIHWYQKKDGEAFQRILYIPKGGGDAVRDTGYENFKCEKQPPDTFILRIPNLKTSDSATYYCACWVSHMVMAADSLFQEKSSLTKSIRKSAHITCKGTGSCRSYIHWYQKKEGEAFKRILYMALTGGTPVKDMKDENFNAIKDSDTYKLTIDNLQPSHSATYYCACWVDHSDRNATERWQKTQTKL
ncbi:hypothetical protein JZ751_007611 [Albula glossodonta]|uniref:Ig-like domain-containing protein n=1 Tax=Albula glossodonta TaxID=121402 RepID=A0A8T2ML54_9TELE|nr:hypothetical protein JZ751_007611 [Albula glossodonta]